jgi:hypothetical protein
LSIFPIRPYALLPPPSSLLPPPSSLILLHYPQLPTLILFLRAYLTEYLLNQEHFSIVRFLRQLFTSELERTRASLKEAHGPEEEEGQDKEAGKDEEEQEEVVGKDKESEDRGKDREGKKQKGKEDNGKEKEQDQGEVDPGKTPSRTEGGLSHKWIVFTRCYIPPLSRRLKQLMLQPFLADK